MHDYNNGARQAQQAHWRDQAFGTADERAEKVEAIADKLPEDAGVRVVDRAHPATDTEAMAMALPSGVLVLEPDLVPDDAPPEIKRSITLLRDIALVIGLTEAVDDVTEEERSAVEHLAGLAVSLGMATGELIEAAQLEAQRRTGKATEDKVPHHYGHGMYL